MMYMKIVFGYLIVYSYLLCLLLSVEFLQKKYHVNEEVLRKIVHVMAGLSWFIMVSFFGVRWHLVIVPFTFILVNTFLYYSNRFTAMKRSKNESKGTIYFAISFTILAFITVLYPPFLPFYGIGALAMTFGDGFAPFIGKLASKHILHSSKTYLGSFFIFGVIAVLCFLFSQFYSFSFAWWQILIISFCGTLAELIGFRGLDNLTLPFVVSFLSYLFAL